VMKSPLLHSLGLLTAAVIGVAAAPGEAPHQRVLSRSPPAASPPNSTAINSVGLQPCPPTASRTLFEKLPGSVTGIDLVHTFPTNAPFDLFEPMAMATWICMSCQEASSANPATWSFVIGSI
jgi:hypothetical protein